MARDADFDTTLAAAQTGAEWALAVLYRQLQPRVLRYLRAQAGADAEDVAAEAWIDIARGLRGFSGDEDAFRGWVFTIVRRRLTDDRRRRGRRPTSAGDAALEVLQGWEDTEGQALDEGRLGDEAARRLVASLPPELAEIVLLRVVAGLDVDEVAAIVGRKPGTVRVLQHRALKRLAKDLGENSDDV